MPSSPNTKALATIELMSGTLAKLMPRMQRQALISALGEEEGAGIGRDLLELAEKLKGAPKTYDQDGKGMDAIAHLHYFHGSMDFYITELDRVDLVSQAFGWANLGDPECAELGYISITELVRNGIELDLHFTPKRLKECVK